MNKLNGNKNRNGTEIVNALQLQLLEAVGEEAITRRFVADALLG